MEGIQKNNRIRHLIKVSVFAILCVLGGMAIWQSHVQEKAEAARHVLQNPRVGESSTTWDCVWFGRYLQEDGNDGEKADQESGEQRIKWRVLSVEGDTILLLADKNLDAKRYHETSASVTWQTSTIRSWLNGYGASDNAQGIDYSKNSFLRQAFTAAEMNDIKDGGIANQNDVKDKVFLLSKAEASTVSYGFHRDINSASSTREAKNTSYAVGQGVVSSATEAYEGNGDWWLRDNLSAYASYVSRDGGDGSKLNDVASSGLGVRPVVRVSFSSSRWSYAGTVGSDGSASEPEEAEGVVEHLFMDYSYGDPVSAEGIEIYANGLASKGKMYKTATVYTDILASYIYTEDKNKNVVASIGKVIVGITLEDSEPEISKGKIVTGDASKIATASIKNGKITITAKAQGGEVFLWVVDTGDKSVMTSCPVNVKVAPTTLNTYAESDFEYGVTPKCSKLEVELDEPTSVYLYPTYTLSREVIETEDATYTASVESKVDKVFSIRQSESDPKEFVIQATGLISNKKTSGKVTIQCVESGKKVDITVTAVNKVRKIEFLQPSSNLTADDKGENFSVSASAKAKVTGNLEIKTTLSSASFSRTDGVTVYTMGSKGGYNDEKMEKGSVSITSKPTTKQKQVTASVNGNKLNISVAKGAKPETTYFLLVYNTKYESAERYGYKEFSVKVE